MSNKYGKIPAAKRGLEIQRLFDLRERTDEEFDAFQKAEDQICKINYPSNYTIERVMQEIELQRIARKRVEAYNAVHRRHEAAEQQLLDVMNANPREFKGATVAIEWKDEPLCEKEDFELAAKTYRKEDLIADAVKRGWTKFGGCRSTGKPYPYGIWLDAVVSDIRKGLPMSAENFATIAKLESEICAQKKAAQIKEALEWEMPLQ